jgi:hypothetical protein
LKPTAAALLLFLATVTGKETVWSPTIIGFNGTVRIRRDGWKAWTPIQFGIAVHQGDLLDTEAGASVQLLCSDLRKASLGEGQTAGAPCDSNAVPINTAEGYRIPMRGDSAQSGHGVILVSPRWTRIRETNPTIRWIAPPDMTKFEVTVRGGGIDWNRTVRSKTSLQYPAEAPHLMAGRQYSVLITSGALSSTRSSEPWPFFEIASQVQIDALNRQLQALRTLGLSPEKTGILDAKVLANLGFNAEAIDRLEKVSTSSNEAITYRLLGEMYRNAGLDYLAVDRYRKALQKSVASGDSDGAAMAADALGTLCSSIGVCDAGEAQKHLREALKIYEALGAEKQVKRLRAQLSAFE